MAWCGIKTVCDMSRVKKCAWDFSEMLRMHYKGTVTFHKCKQGDKCVNYSCTPYQLGLIR